MGKNITVGEGHTERVKTDHRNGKQTVVQDNVEVRPVMEGYHNEYDKEKPISVSKEMGFLCMTIYGVYCHFLPQSN